MIKTIGDVLSEVNIEISNNKVRFSYTHDTLDARGNAIVIDQNNSICTGIWNMDEISSLKVYSTSDALLSYDINDFIIDYEFGKLTPNFSAQNISKIVINGWKWEMNLDSQKKAWNQACYKINCHFANDRFIKIDEPSGYGGEDIESLDRDDYPFSSFTSIAGIYKNETDRNSFVLTERANKIYIRPRKNIENELETQFGYNVSSGNDVEYLTYPFFIRGGYVLPIIATDVVTDKAIELYIERPLYLQLKLLLKYYLFESLYYQTMNNEASNKTFFKLKGLNDRMFAISNEIKIENFTNQVPKQIKMPSARSNPDYFNTFE